MEVTENFENLKAKYEIEVSYIHCFNDLYDIDKVFELIREKLNELLDFLDDENSVMFTYQTEELSLENRAFNDMKKGSFRVNFKSNKRDIKYMPFVVNLVSTCLDKQYWVDLYMHYQEDEHELALDCFASKIANTISSFLKLIIKK